ncbi:MAG TPA: tetratricopeptide repeat protein [Roseiarcus sp.]|nr:tetratricopeptide repeat protein [Roseiarcus sp.]
MSSIAFRRRVVARKLGPVWLLSSFLALGGCYDSDDITGSISRTPAVMPTNDVASSAYADEWKKRYDANPGEKVASINYARALRALNRYDQAVAVIQSAAVKAPNDFEILGALGKALADDGQLQRAADVLSRSYAPENPDWSDMSAQGSVADQLGDHAAAQGFYLSALKIAPNEPSILNNLGLSFALTKQLPEAEKILRQAAAAPGADQRVRDNLALVLALEGKFNEAESISRRDMSAEAAAANVTAVRHMIAPANPWKEIKEGDAKRREDSTALTTAPASTAE